MDGSMTHCTNSAATAASMALPPSSRTSRAASPASRREQATAWRNLPSAPSVAGATVGTSSPKTLRAQPNVSAAEPCFKNARRVCKTLSPAPRPRSEGPGRGVFNAHYCVTSMTSHYCSEMQYKWPSPRMNSSLPTIAGVASIAPSSSVLVAKISSSRSCLKTTVFPSRLAK